MIRQVQKTSVFFLCLLLFGAPAVFAAGHGISEAETSFIQFKDEWVQKLNKHCKYGKENAEVTTNGDGLYVAQYSEMAEPSYEVKETGVKESPYVGILRYDKTTYSAEAATKEDALNGPFKTVSLQGVTEIFRYSKGKWIY